MSKQSLKDGGKIEKSIEEPKEEKKLNKIAKRQAGIDLIGYLGGRLVVKMNEKIINGKKFNDCILADGTGVLLSDKDLEAQLTKEEGKLKY